MGKVIAGMTMSVDGFVHDAQGSMAELYPDLEALRDTELMEESIRITGAVVMGRRTFEMGDPDLYADHYEYQVPIFVLTHHPPAKHPREAGNLTITFVEDGVVSAIQKVKMAAGEKDVVVVGGVSTIQQCLNARLVDELQVGIMPVLFASGLRYFDLMPGKKILLEKSRVIETDQRTDLIFSLSYQS